MRAKPNDLSRLTMKIALLSAAFCYLQQIDQNAADFRKFLAIARTLDQVWLLLQRFRDCQHDQTASDNNSIFLSKMSNPFPNNIINVNTAIAAADVTVITDNTILAEDYQDILSDESQLHCDRIASLVFPRSLPQLVGALRWHHARGNKVTISGARTGLVGGAVPQTDGHIISLSRTQGVSDAGKDNLGRPLVRVLAGTPLADLYDWIDKHHPGWFYPVDPTETSASLGGNIAANASGARSLHYGTTRDWIHGIRVVLVDGGVCDLTRKTTAVKNGQLELCRGNQSTRIQASRIPKPQTKHSLGYCWEEGMDVVDLFVGAEGTLGVVYDAVIALTPAPAAQLHLLQFFQRSDDAFNYVAYLRNTPTLTPLAIEWMDGRSLRLVVQSPAAQNLRSTSMVDDNTIGAVYAAFSLTAQQEADAALETLAAFFATHNIDAAHSMAGTTHADRREIRAFRHAIPEQVNKRIAAARLHDPNLRKLATDFAVPNDQLRSFYADVEQVTAATGIDFVIFGHIGNAHLHVNLLPTNQTQRSRGRELYKTLCIEAVRRGGSVAAEHGIGRLKREFLALQYSPNVLASMRRIKSGFDPHWQLNPGVLL